jgi:hypothetical protein
MSDDVCSRCGGDLDDGEGYDGLCGDCADQDDKEEREYWADGVEIGKETDREERIKAIRERIARRRRAGELKDIWLLALEKVQTRITPGAYRNWFPNTYLVELNDTTAVISAVNSFTASILQKRFQRLIQESLFEATGRIVVIEVRSTLSS